MNRMYVDNMYLPHIFSLPKGLNKSGNNPYRCGAWFEGDGSSAEGYFFACSHQELFTVSICDFYSKDTCRLWMPPMRYVAFRGNLDEVGRVRFPKLYLEENERETHALLRKGSPVRYVEVEFYPAYYEHILREDSATGAVTHGDIWKSIPGDLPWPHEVVQVLVDIKNCAYTGRAAELYFTGKGNELMSHILQADVLRASGNSADGDGIAGVVAYIDEHFCGDVRQTALSRIARMSPTKLKELFKKIMGRTITEYVLERRMKKAMRLLASRDLTIGEVAAGAGYETATGFAASFKKQTGFSPTAYRKNVETERINNPSNLSDIVF